MIHAGVLEWGGSKLCLFQSKTNTPLPLCLALPCSKWYPILIVPVKVTDFNVLQGFGNWNIYKLFTLFSYKWCFTLIYQLRVSLNFCFLCTVLSHLYKMFAELIVSRGYIITLTHNDCNTSTVINNICWDNR